MLRTNPANRFHMLQILREVVQQFCGSSRIEVILMTLFQWFLSPSLELEYESQVLNEKRTHTN